MKKLLPILLVVFGLIGGAGVGLMLKPMPADCLAAGTATEAEGHGAEATAGECIDDTSEDHAADVEGHEAPAADGHDAPVSGTVEYVRLERQFVIPIISPERVRALVVLSLSIEVTSGASEQVYAHDPKLRDAFLQVLFRHANSGGFDGAFTTGQPMSDLRNALRAASHDVLGDLSKDVLVVDITRQDI